jgi:hypothetical protein
LILSIERHIWQHYGLRATDSDFRRLLGFDASEIAFFGPQNDKKSRQPIRGLTRIDLVEMISHGVDWPLT